MKRRDTIFISLTLSIFIPIFITLMVLDWKISHSFVMQKNWFTIIFAEYGSNIYVVPVFFCLINTLNYVLHRFQHRKLSRTLWFSLFYLLFMGLYLYVFINKEWKGGLELNGASNRSVRDIVSLIFVIFIAFLCGGYAIGLSASHFLSSSEMARFLFRQTMYALIFIGFLSITTNGLKLFFGRPRPSYVIDIMNDKSFFYYALEPCFKSFSGFSFPSGHTSDACIALSLVFFIPKQNKKINWITIIVIWSLILCTATARVLAHAHWSTDVTFAMFEGLIYFWATPKIYQSLNRKRRNK